MADAKESQRKPRKVRAFFAWRSRRGSVRLDIDPDKFDDTWQAKFDAASKAVLDIFYPKKPDAKEAT